MTLHLHVCTHTVSRQICTIAGLPDAMLCSALYTSCYPLAAEAFLGAVTNGKLVVPMPAGLQPICNRQPQPQLGFPLGHFHPCQWLHHRLPDRQVHLITVRRRPAEQPTPEPDRGLPGAAGRQREHCQCSAIPQVSFPSNCPFARSPEHNRVAQSAC